MAKREHYRLNTEIFIERSTKRHNGKYSYEKTNYTNKRAKVIITCPIHGDFEQWPRNHMNGQGCPECGKIIARERKMNCKNHRKTKEEFQVELDKIFDGKYEIVGEYINNKTKIEIFCHNISKKTGKEHGIFSAKPNDLIHGHGCHRCIKSKIEQEIEVLLNNCDIDFIPQKHFDWLKKQSLDFYLPKYGIGIECQGIQHFIPIDFEGHGGDFAIKNFEKVKRNDIRKKELCKENNVHLLYYANYKYDFPCEVITDKQELLTRILNYDQK